MGAVGGLLFLRGAVHSHLEHSIQVRQRSPLSRLPCPTLLRSCSSRFSSNRDLPIACPAGTHIPARRQGGWGVPHQHQVWIGRPCPPKGPNFLTHLRCRGKTSEQLQGHPMGRLSARRVGTRGVLRPSAGSFPATGVRASGLTSWFPIAMAHFAIKNTFKASSEETRVKLGARQKQLYSSGYWYSSLDAGPSLGF